MSSPPSLLGVVRVEGYLLKGGFSEFHRIYQDEPDLFCDSNPGIGSMWDPMYRRNLMDIALHEFSGVPGGRKVLDREGHVSQCH